VLTFYAERYEFQDEKCIRIYTLEHEAKDTTVKCYELVLPDL
jgi:hypothetical protein